MKKIFAFLALALLPFALFCAPFGLKMGMTLEEVAEQCEVEPIFLKNESYAIIPKKRHSLFKTYFISVNKEKGLYEIGAITDHIETNEYGTELQNSFYDIKDRISKTYGTPRINDYIDSSASSFFQENDNWFYTLQKGARTLNAVWNNENTQKDNLSDIYLTCGVTSGVTSGKGIVSLCYTFQNANDIQDSEDEVF